MSNHILVGVDGSAPSRAALDWAAERARRLGVPLRILTVVPRGADLRDGLVELGLRRRREDVESANPTLRVSSRIASGRVVPELASAAADALMVVVGTHKTGYLRGRVIGSRGLQLAAMSPVPTAIIPEPSGRDRRGIVVGVGAHDPGDRVVRFGASEAHRLQTSLTLVRALDNPGTAASGQIVDSVLSTARRRARDLAQDVDMRMRVVRGPAIESLLDAGRSAELLVIGASPHAASGAAVLGHISHDVLVNITGPTVVVNRVRHPLTRRMQPPDAPILDSNLLALPGSPVRTQRA